MSIEKTPKGEYRVRWREGGRNRAQTIGPRKADAIAFEANLKLLRSMGELGDRDRGGKLFRTFFHEWCRSDGRSRGLSTQRNYAWAADTYVLPRFGHLPLRAIKPMDVKQWMADLECQGTGPHARHKALRLLKQILNAAVEYEELGRNPVAAVKVPSVPAPPVMPPTPAEVESIRRALLDNGRMGDAVLVSVMAYAGLRPHEVWPLTWDDVGEKTLLVRTAQKVGSKPRSVPLLKPLAQDLREWRFATGQRHHIVFPNQRVQEWTPSTFNNWRRRIFKPIAPTRRPYDLRHTYVSLMIREGRSVVEIAARAGHAPDLCLRIYGHLWEELSGTGSAESAIAAARQKLREEAV